MAENKKNKTVSSASKFSLPLSSSDASLRTERQSLAVAPSMRMQPGDVKKLYKLSDGSSLTILIKANKEKLYQLHVYSGEKIYLEKTKSSASLMLLDHRGHVTKMLGCIVE